MAPASLTRTRAVVRGAFTAARKRRLLDWDPFDAVDAPVLRDHDQVDPDLVMSPADVIAIAHACAQIDPRYKAFVLTQGLCGLRPGEAVELRVRNLTITDGHPTAVTVRGTPRRGTRVRQVVEAQDLRFADQQAEESRGPRAGDDPFDGATEPIVARGPPATHDLFRLLMAIPRRWAARHHYRVPSGLHRFATSGWNSDQSRAVDRAV